MPQAGQQQHARCKTATLQPVCARHMMLTHAAHIRPSNSTMIASCAQASTTSSEASAQALTASPATQTQLGRQLTHAHHQPSAASPSQHPPSTMTNTICACSCFCRHSLRPFSAGAAEGRNTARRLAMLKQTLLSKAGGPKQDAAPASGHKHGGCSLAAAALQQEDLRKKKAGGQHAKGRPPRQAAGL
jgi:hypothetical protein